MALKISIITPEKMVFEGVVNGVSLPSSEGEITILKDHLPLVTLLKSGEITLHKDSGKQHIAVHSGFVEVANNEVKLLTDAAETAEDIDERRAEEALARAKQSRERATDLKSQADSLAAIERAITRLKLVERRKRRHQA